MSRVLILGGGFGGVAAATRLRELAGDAEIVLADRGVDFAMGFRKISEIVGRAAVEEGARPLSALQSRGVRVVRGEIEEIDPAARAARVGGERIEADALLVALGAETVPQAVPGLVDHGINVYERSGVPRAAEALASLESGRRLAIGIFGVPYKCPPAPYELALLAQDALRARGVRATVTAFTPQPVSMPLLGPAGCEVIEGRLLGGGVDFRPSSKAERVEAGRVLLAGGDAIPFDVLFAVPPHRVPAAVVAAGLAPEGGWVKVDPGSMATTFDGVFAAGDIVGIKMANDNPLPKAGAFAEAMGLTAAEHIAARLRGGSSDAVFGGEGACFLEVGGGEAMLVRGRFLARPAPDIELTPPSKETLEEKGRFERERLDAWFGSA